MMREGVRLRRLLLLAISLAGLAACEPGRDVPLDAERGAVLPLAEGPDAVNPCTRWRPLGVTSFWTPSREEIARLEARLGAVIQDALARPWRAKTATTADDYYRQYVGIRRWTGRRTIYVIGVHEYNFEMWRKSRFDNPTSFPGSDSVSWRENALGGCDGGRLFFGVEYDPMFGTFGRLWFNDIA